MRIVAYTIAAYTLRLDEWLLYFLVYAHYIYSINYGVY